MSARTDRLTPAITEALEPRLLLSASYPTGYEQYLVELTNSTRADPAAWATYYGIDLNEGLSAGTIDGTPKQPLAVNPYIVSAAQGHTIWESAADVYDHWGPGLGDDAHDRMEAEGYVFAGGWGWGENIDLIIDWQVPGGILYVPDLTHERFFVDDGVDGRGHRINLMEPDFKEIGTGIFDGTFGVDDGYFVAVDFAYSGVESFLTGVVFDDSLSLVNQFYTPGEGLGDVEVTAIRVSDGQAYGPVTTWDAGGYSLQVPDGTYDVWFSGDTLPQDIKVGGVVVAGENVKVDLNRNDTPAMPDLAVQTLQSSSVYALPDRDVDVDVRIRNRGDFVADEQFDVALYLSDDSAVTTDDTLVAMKTLVNLPALTTWAETMYFDSPSIDGVYYLAVLVDAGNDVDEGDEANNWGDVFTLTIGQPDLTAALTKVRLPGTLVPGDKGTVTVTVANDGGIPAADDVAVNLYAAENADGTGQSHLLDTAVKRVDLAPGGGSASYVMKVTIPDTIVAGLWYLVAEADVAAAIWEADEDNNTGSEVDPRELKWAFGTFDDRKGAKLAVRDGAGTLVTFSMGGGGWGEIVGGSAFDEVIAHETTMKSSLKIASKVPTAVVDIVVDEHVKSIIGKTVSLLGDIDIGGGVKAVTLADVADDHRIDIHTDGGLVVAAKTQVTFKLGRVTDCIINSPDVPIKALTVIDWQDTDGTDSITAPLLGKLTTKGRKADAVAGDFAADLILTDAAAKVTLGRAKIAGDLTARLWDIAGAAGTLTVKGAARGIDADNPLTIRAGGGVKSITLGAVEHADFLVGVGAIGGRYPTAAGDFADQSSTIKSIKLKPQKVAKSAPYPDLFIDANFAAATIGKVSIANAVFANGGEAFGFRALDQGTGKEIAAVQYKDLNDKANNWSWPKTAAAAPLDMAITIL